MGAGNATKGVPGRTPSRFTKPTRDGNQEDRNGKQSINPKCLNVSRRREARWGARDRPGRWRRTFAAALCRVQQPHAVSTSLTATGIPTHLQRRAVGDIPSQAGLPARVLVFLVSGMAAPLVPWPRWPCCLPTSTWGRASRPHGYVGARSYTFLCHQHPHLLGINQN